MVAALVTLSSWALASAPGSAPDDNYHMASIWCAGDECPVDPRDSTRRQPPAEVPGAACFSQDSAKSAQCQEDLPSEMEPGKATAIGNWNGQSYPPLFYATMNLFITGELESSVLLMRLFNGALLLLLLAALVLALPPRLKPMGAVPMLITSVPLGLSLIPSTNPSSWAIAGSATIWPALYGAFEASGRRRGALLCLVVLGVLVAAGARGDAALFAMGAIGLVLLLRIRELRHNKALVGVALAGFAIAGYFFLTSGQATVVVSGGFGIPPTEVLPWHQVAISNLQQLPVLWAGSLGFGFMASAGWLDTPFPALVGFFATVAWVAYVFGSWREMYGNKAFAVLSVGVAMVVYPVVMLGLSGAFVGTGFQPRYLLPLLIILTTTSMMSRGAIRSPFTRFQAIAVTVALAVAQSVALHTQIRRYVTGLDVGGINLDRAREWWWDIPISATAAWVLGTIGFAVVAWALLRPSETGSAGRQESPEGRSRHDQVAISESPERDLQAEGVHRG